MKPFWLILWFNLSPISVKSRSRYFIEWDHWLPYTRGYPIDVCQAMGSPTFGFTIYKLLYDKLYDSNNMPNDTNLNNFGFPVSLSSPYRVFTELSIVMTLTLVDLNLA